MGGSYFPNSFAVGRLSASHFGVKNNKMGFTDATLSCKLGRAWGGGHLTRHSNFLKGLNMKMTSIKWALSISAAAVLVACGGGGDDIKVAAANTTVTATAATAAAVVNQTFSLPAVPALGTTAATTLKIAGTATAQTVEIASGGQTATGPITYGSCIMNITTSTFPTTHPLGVGKTVTVNPCDIVVQTAGVTTGAAVTNTGVTINLGGVSSSPVTIPVAVSDSGAVTIGSTVVGNTTVTVRTGA